MSQWNRFRKTMECNRASRIRPVLVLGSGFLRQVGFRREAEWTHLLRIASKALGVSFNAHAASEVPTLYWDSLISQARLTPRWRNASNHQAERAALAAVRDILKRPIPHGPNRDLGQEILNSDVQAIASLNFVLTPFVHGVPRPIKSKNSVIGVNVNKKRIWLPHGHVGNLASMRLGATSYRRVLECMESERVLTAAHAHDRGPKHVSMLKDCLNAPLVFAGCGLQHAEWTMHWLLATKSRANHRSTAIAKCWVISDEVVSTGRRELLRHLGCEVIVERCHRDYWKNLLVALGCKATKWTRTRS